MMWLRQYSVHEVLSLREGHYCRLLLSHVLNVPTLRQAMLASHMRKPQPGKRNASYYEVLEISPKATQAQVKDAYYKLSKQYHPDQYRGDEDPTTKFREIKEAYEILGNFSQRKMYDKGLLGAFTAATPAEAEEYSSRFYESRRKRGAVPTASGRTPIYNFDEWSKIHYSSTRIRKENARERFEKVMRERSEVVEEKKTQSFISALLLAGVMVFMYCFRSQDYDSETTKRK